MKNDRICLVICGAGFDPRSTIIFQKLYDILNERLEAFLIKEERPNPDSELVRRADQNYKMISELCPTHVIEPINIFANDGAVIGGHNIIKAISKIDLSKFTDIIIDTSALSIGISSPIISYLYTKVQGLKGNVNLH